MQAAGGSEQQRRGTGAGGRGRWVAGGCGGGWLAGADLGVWVTCADLEGGGLMDPTPRCLLQRGVRVWWYAAMSAYQSVVRQIM